MGYNLTIGELKVICDNGEYPECGITADGFEIHDAPAFGEPTDRTSERWPSYSSWSDCMEFCGLSHLFDRDSEYTLIATHPGCVPITEEHRAIVNDALQKFKSDHPDAVPTYGKASGTFESDPSNPKENSYMCRLVWLHYWINWALDNCKQPVFANS